MIKAVIFDLDGTLITFNLDIRTCRKEIIKRLAKLGFAQNLFSLKETAFDMLVKVKQQMETDAFDEQKFEEIRDMVFSVVESHELKAAKTTQMFEGIPQTLNSLKAMDLKLGLCTISGEKATNYSLTRFKVGHLFDAVITRDLVPEVKPNQIHLEATLNALDIKPNEAVLVGDSTKDMACAAKVNVLAVGVTTGLSSKESLINAGANYVMSSANYILPILEQLNRK